MNQVTACSCGFLFEEADAFCPNCGSRRARSAPQQRHGGGASTTKSLESAGPAPFDADALYLQKTLRHEPMELALNDAVSAHMFGVLMARAWLAWAVVIIPLGLIGALVAVGGGGVIVLVPAFLVSIAVFWIVLLTSKVIEPIGEWRTLLADRGGQAEPYYRMITAVLQRRELPITARLRSIQLNTAGRPVKHTIALSEREYQAYVTVFPYGTSLYVGWQMWRRRSGAELVKRFLVDLVKGADLVTVMLRTDRARAVREAVHLACREAVYAPQDDSMWVLAQQVRLPPVEQESALLPRQPASPVLPPPATPVPVPSTAPTPAAWAAPAPPRPAAPGENAL